MIELSHVYKTYAKKHHVLKNLQLKVRPGEFIFLMGPSGAGKTTLFRMITGFDRPTSGNVRVNSCDLESVSRHSLAQFRRSIGVVFQDFKLLYDRTVFENVALPLRIQKMHQWKVLEKVEDILNKVNLRKKRDENPIYLSGGEKQRVAIARALVHDPDLIIADEPTGNLDWKLSQEIMTLFKEANRKGVTVIIATHDQELIKNTKKKRIIKIDEGQLYEDGEQQPCGHFFKPLEEVGLSIL